MKKLNKENGIICPICVSIIRDFTENSKGRLFICPKCKTEVFVPNEEE